MKLYTKTGDSGETSLFDGTRVAKDDPRVASYGDIDELNAALGWCRCAGETGVIATCLRSVQEDLFVMGAELATPPGSKAGGRLQLIGDRDIERLEGWIDDATGVVPPLRHFVLPGGSELGARLHIARTCCRRAERAIVTLGRSSPVRPVVLIYLNRLSDLLFAWSRQANHEAATRDIEWIPRH